jgi:hypothetical protein
MANLGFAGGFKYLSCHHVLDLKAERFWDLDVGFVGGGGFGLKVA